MTTAFAPMTACSFHGTSVAGPGFVLFLAGVLAALLTPVGIGAAIGWCRGRRAGHRWLGLLQGGAWVLGAYLLALLLWWTSVVAERQQRAADWRLEQALLDPIRTVQPGGWSDVLEATRQTTLTPSQRRSWLGAIVLRAAQPEAWTAADLQALEQLASSPQAARQRTALRALVIFHREGDSGLARLRAACANDAACLRHIDVPVGIHDSALLSREQALLWQVERAPPALSAALERTLRRQRAEPHRWSSHGDARLAFDRLRHDHLGAALEACNLPLGPAADRLSAAQQQCLEQLLRAIDRHGAERLCRDGTLTAADQATLTQFQRQIADEPRWLTDTVSTTWKRLILACRRFPGR